MTVDDLKAMSEDALGERFRSLRGAYDEACMAYDHAKAAEIHREFYAVEDEIQSRGGAERRRTGREALSLEDMVERFIECAIAYDDADGSDETEHLYWDLEHAEAELQRRPGDQRRVLFRLYMHPDIRVRAAAAGATRTLAPLLSRHRQLNIDDDNWMPPASGLDIAQAGLDDLFPMRTEEPDRLTALNLEQLTQRFLELALAQYRAELDGEIAKYNRQFFQVLAVELELKDRPGDQRSALVPLFSHPNPQVRLLAATANLAVVPEAARRALQILADSKEHPQAGEANGRLRNLDSGFFKPT